MQAPHSFSLAGQNLWLSGSRVVYWENNQTLILSDCHFGKTGHFRKAGIAVPQVVFRNDLQRLFECIHFFGPRRLLIVGDFFHSVLNREAELFARWRADHEHLLIDLVKGNHDIFDRDWYQQNGIRLWEDSLEEGPFCFIHEWSDGLPGSHYYFSGHLHPGVGMQGSGRQHLLLPCFYFTETHAILPAFGEFTGLARIRPARDARVFVIASRQIHSLQ